MVHATVEDVIASSPHTILPTVQGEPDYHTIHSIRKILRANARSIESYTGGGDLGHLGIILSITTYATYATITLAHPWENTELPAGATNEIVGGTAAAVLAERHHWEEAVVIFRTWKTVEQALKNKLSWHLSQCTLKFLKMTWLDSLTQLQETCSNTSFSPIAALLLLTFNTTGKICVTHGTHSRL
jgi:hypothetical protein